MNILPNLLNHQSGDFTYKAKSELNIFSPRVLSKRAVVIHIHTAENRQFFQFKTGNFSFLHFLGSQLR